MDEFLVIIQKGVPLLDSLEEPFLNDAGSFRYTSGYHLGSLFQILSGNHFYVLLDSFLAPFATAIWLHFDSHSGSIAVPIWDPISVPLWHPSLINSGSSLDPFWCPFQVPLVCPLWDHERIPFPEPRHAGKQDSEFAHSAFSWFRLWIHSGVDHSRKEVWHWTLCNQQTSSG